MTQSASDERGDRDELRSLMFRYAQAVDRRDYAAFQEIFAEEAILTGYREDPESLDALFRYEGRAVIQESLKAIERYEKTFHLVGNSLFEASGDGAEGESYCMAHHIYRRDGIAWNRTMAIRYQDRFVRREGQWQILSRALRIDFEMDVALGKEGWA
jgi:3-phenylpropionate/cinnamic acid dioxygenase small subunit